MDSLRPLSPIPKSETTVALMFDAIAPRYDLLNRLTSLRQDQRWRRRLVHELPRAADGHLLDVATGTGDVLVQAWEQRPDYTRFHGVDISEKMLHLARAKTRALGINQIEFQQMSGQSLNFEDNTFDAVSISFGLRNLVDKEAALREYQRVLKPGGMLLILEFFPRDFKEKRATTEKPFATTDAGELRTLPKAFRFYFHHILPRLGAMMSQKEAYQYLPASVDQFMGPAALKELMRQAHFISIETKASYLFGSCQLLAGSKTTLLH